MPEPVLTLERLDARHRAPALADAGASDVALVERRLAAALAAIGWRAASDLLPEELAPELRLLVDRCLDHHRDLARLRREVAGFLRANAHPLDGSHAHVSQWEPAALQLLEHYVEGAPDLDSFEW